MITSDEAVRWLRAKTIAEATSVGMPDSIFGILCYNRTVCPGWPHQTSAKVIEPNNIFPEESTEVIQDWLSRAIHLARSAAAALAERPEDLVAIMIQLGEENPGFSKKTYTDAVSNTALHIEGL